MPMVSASPSTTPAIACPGILVTPPRKTAVKDMKKGSIPIMGNAQFLAVNKKAPTPKGSGGDGVLELRDIALYIDVAAPTAVAEETGSGNGKESSSPLGAKQGVTSFYGCSGSPLGTLSSFGNACGLYGSGYFGGGMLGDTSGFGGGGTIG